MKKLILVLLGIMFAVGFATVNAAAQNGKVALGLRASPDGGGFNARFFATRHFVVETQLNAGGIFQGEGESFNAVVLLEGNIYMPDPSWQIYFGGGMHAGVWDHDGRGYWRGDNYYRDYNSEGIFGMDAIAGVSYKFKSIPLSLSADMKPAVNFLEEARFFNHNFFGLSARLHIR